MRQRSDYPTFSDQEIASRHQSVYRLMEQGNIDALLVYGSGRYASDVYWLSDWPSSREAYVLFQTGKEPVILLQLFNHFPMAKDRKSTRLNSSHSQISYAVFCLKKK